MNNSETKYQYSYVPVEHVIENPDEYIIPECQPACKALWDKNIETFMVSNYDDNDLYVLLLNLSDENKNIIKKLMNNDSRYFYSDYRKGYGIRVVGNDYNSMIELQSLTEVFSMQDTFGFQDTKEFLDEYKKIDGELTITDDGYIVRLENPELENATLEEALMMTGKQDLYVSEEGKIYNSKMYLEWHKRYQGALQSHIEETISKIASSGDNISSDAENLRDSFLTAEKEYVAELLKDERMRDLIYYYNNFSSEMLFEAAQRIVDNVQNGLVPEDEMESIEQELAILLAAIRDKVLVKELVRTPDYDEYSRGRSR